MSALCEGRVVIVTGAGGGIGREHALLFAREGANVVVNDVGGSVSGDGSDLGAAARVVAEIEALGGKAAANTDDISSWAGAQRLVQQAIDTFGKLDVLVNNAGILRDRMMVNMTESEWDAVIAVHLKGTFAPSHFAAEYWREESKAGRQPDARIINTTSPSGIFGNIGQANYGAAKAGIAAFSIITGLELVRYGVTVNAIAPTALTRMTNIGPERISPLVVWLGSSASAKVTGRVFGITGNKISVAEGWVYGPTIDRETPWTPGELGEVLPGLVAEAAGNAPMSGERADLPV
jgi:NAD(P)-dependent dehydrogenase (short-subunit alcohol dehydrogenase family)